MLSFLKRKNTEAVSISFLKAAGIHADYQAIVRELDMHPDYPSLLAISDVLTNFGVKNNAFRCPAKELESLPTPFIVHTKEDDCSFIVVHSINSEWVIATTEKWDKLKLPYKNFVHNYGGVALVAEIPEMAPSFSWGQLLKSFRSTLIFTSLFLLTILLIISNFTIVVGLTWQMISILICKSAGLGIAILLLLQSIDKDNPLVQALCTAGGNNSDCNAILSSKAAMAFWGYSWSEIGFFYFAGTWLFTVFGNGSALLLRTLLLLNILSLPYTFYSIYYQARVAKRWCLFCCIIQALFWIEFVPLLNANLMIGDYSIHLKKLFVLIVCLLVPVVIWAILKPLLIRALEVEPVINQLRIFKYNVELFQLVLSRQPKFIIPDDSYSIVLGNIEAEHVVTIVSNPYCQPCAKAHALLENLLERNDNVQARIVFYTPDNIESDITQVAQHILALSRQPDKALVTDAMNAWFNSLKKDIGTWTKKYPADQSASDLEKLKIQREWCIMAKISATPTIMLDGHLLPHVYSLPDLKYMLA